MMIIPKIPFIAHRRKRPVQTAPAALELVSVTWDTEAGVLSLQFDRAIDISGLNADAIRLKDGVTTNSVLEPYPPVTVVDETTLTMGVLDIEPYAGSDVLLNVAADNGIVAVDDGGTFPGVTDLPVPFP